MHKYKQHVRPKDHSPLKRRPVEELLGDMITAIFADHCGPVLIAIGGPGGTGKSWLAGLLATRLGDASVLRLDDYKTARSDRQDAGIFGPHPDANKMDLIGEHLMSLKKNQAISKPVYDSASGAAHATETFTPARFNLIDGEVSTYRQFRDIVDFAVFIDSHWRTQLATRLDRDLDQRDYTLDKAVTTFLHSNLREFGAHGAESKNWSDAHLFCHDDYRLELESVSGELYQQVGRLLHGDVEEVELTGPVVPMLTPFDDSDKIDRRAFAEHLDWLADGGVSRVLIGDATGELFSLTSNERMELLKLALEYFPGMVLFQTGGGPLADAIALARQAESLGADAICCMPPPGWSEAPQAGIAKYILRVEASVEIPLLDPTNLLHPTANANRRNHAKQEAVKIAQLKHLVRAKIKNYPVNVRPPLIGV
ncbi:MAG: hypothetical protein HN350_14325 [Phycisphaerales bacterium]|jgi:uridine kinase|nr:hypothetical protein [Phycisphaerales bacterium]